MNYLEVPIEIYWDITKQCNLRCKHCYSSSGSKDPNELTTEQAMNFIKEAKNIGIFKISITGGEPLVRPDIIEILNFLKKNKINTTFTTNATLITSEISKILKNTVHYIQVSLDGPDSETHNAIRGKGNFEKTINGIKMLVKDKNKVSISYVANKLNIHKIPEIINLSKKLGVNAFRTLRFVPAGRGNENINEFILSHEKYKKFVSYITKESKTNKELYIIPDCTFGFLTKNTPYYPEKERGNSAGCWAGFYTCSLTYDGEVTPCTTLHYMNKRYTGGNLKNKSFYEIWNNSEFFKEWRNIKLTGKCSKCGYRYICGGNCRAAAFSVYGDYTAPDPNCWFEP